MLADEDPEAPLEAPHSAVDGAADVERAIAEGYLLARAAGDNRKARRMLAALSALAADDDAPDAAQVGHAPVVDLEAERARRR